VRCIQKTQNSPVLWRANAEGQNSMVSCGDPWYVDDLDGTCQPSCKKDNSKIGCAWPPP
jgi:hypothetical protein